MNEEMYKIRSLKVRKVGLPPPASVSGPPAGKRGQATLPNPEPL
jgi:hypothetical protein